MARPLKWNGHWLASEITRHRRITGMSMRDVTKATGVSSATITRVEAGKMPDLITLVALAKFYRIRTDDVVAKCIEDAPE